MLLSVLPSSVTPQHISVRIPSTPASPPHGSVLPAPSTALPTHQTADHQHLDDISITIAPKQHLLASAMAVREIRRRDAPTRHAQRGRRGRRSDTKNTPSLLIMRAVLTRSASIILHPVALFTECRRSSMEHPPATACKVSEPGRGFTGPQSTAAMARPHLCHGQRAAAHPQCARKKHNPTRRRARSII